MQYYIEPIVALIGQIGFPGAVAVFLMVSRHKREKQFDERYDKLSAATNERLRELSDAIQANTQVMTLVTTKI